MHTSCFLTIVWSISYLCLHSFFGAKLELKCQFVSFGREYWATLEQSVCSPGSLSTTGPSCFYTKRNDCSLVTCWVGTFVQSLVSYRFCNIRIGFDIASFWANGLVAPSCLTDTQPSRSVDSLCCARALVLTSTQSLELLNFVTVLYHGVILWLLLKTGSLAFTTAPSPWLDKLRLHLDQDYLL